MIIALRFWCPIFSTYHTQGLSSNGYSSFFLELCDIFLKNVDICEEKQKIGIFFQNSNISQSTRTYVVFESLSKWLHHTRNISFKVLLLCHNICLCYKFSRQYTTAASFIFGLAQPIWTQPGFCTSAIPGM